MSRSKREQRAREAPAHASTDARNPRRSKHARRNAIIAMLVLVAIAGAWFARRRAVPPKPASTTMPFAALVDSATRASTGHDLDAAVRWAGALAARVPTNSSVLLNYGIALHNRSLSHDLRGGDSHPALRNSLERIETRRRVLELMDSAMATAQTPADWIHAREYQGEALETLGLPIDAIEAYVDIRKRAPDDARSATRIVWVREHLRNPLLPDTVETQ
jgi:hypothetical protein